MLHDFLIINWIEFKVMGRGGGCNRMIFHFIEILSICLLAFHFVQLVWWGLQSHNGYLQMSGFLNWHYCHRQALMELPWDVLTSWIMLDGYYDALVGTKSVHLLKKDRAQCSVLTSGRFKGNAYIYSQLLDLAVLILASWRRQAAAANKFCRDA